jgi:hypothetical protein
MSEDIRKQLISGALEMVQMTQHRTVIDEELEANMDTWGVVHGALAMDYQLSSDELNQLVEHSDRDQLIKSIADIVGRVSNDLAQDAATALAVTLSACCGWVERQSGSDAADEMLTHLRESLAED